MIAIAFIVAAVIGVWQAVAARVRRRSLVDHEPRALKLLDAPKKSEPIRFDDLNELFRTLREEAQRQTDANATRPVQLPIAGPGRSRRG